MIYRELFVELEKTGVKYLVIGGMAVILHGYPRATADLDIMVLLDADNLKDFISVVNKLGYKPRLPVKIEALADPKQRKLWAETKNMLVFTLYNPRQEFEQVDVAINYFVDFAKAYQRRTVLDSDGVAVSVASIDDVIKMKENSGRSRDIIDIQALKEIKKVKHGKKDK